MLNYLSRDLKIATKKSQMGSSHISLTCISTFCISSETKKWRTRDYKKWGKNNKQKKLPTFFPWALKKSTVHLRFSGKYLNKNFLVLYLECWKRVPSPCCWIQWKLQNRAVEHSLCPSIWPLFIPTFFYLEFLFKSWKFLLTFFRSVHQKPFCRHFD